jgi:hypothetical protein
MAHTSKAGVCITKELRVSLLQSLGETEDVDDDGGCPDTDFCCSVIEELHQSNSSLLHASVKFRISARVMTPSVALLTLYGVPILTSEACANVHRIGFGDEVIDVKAEFEDDENRLHQDGCVKVQFWRSSFPRQDRKFNVYLPVSRERELTYTPDWEELGIQGAEFDTDRQRLLKIMKTCYNVNDLMPKGINCKIELIRDRKVCLDENDKFVSSRKRGRDAHQDTLHANKNRKSNGKLKSNRASGGEDKHIGYCLYFYNGITPLPEVVSSFAEYHLRPLIGPAFKSWLVIFPEIRQVGTSSPSIERRPEEFCVILRRSTVTDETMRPYTIAGAHGLMERIRACSKFSHSHGTPKDTFEPSTPSETTAAAISTTSHTIKA